MTFKMSDVMTIRPELSYSQKKYAFTDNIDILQKGFLKVSESNSYLCLPVMFTFRTGDEVLSAFVNFGPEFALLVDHQRDLYATSGGLEITADPYYDFDVNAYDFGASVGGGIQFRPVIIDARFFLSLRPLYSGKTSLEMRYMNAYINVAYLINYQPPASFSRPTTWRSFKYKLRHLFR